MKDPVDVLLKKIEEQQNIINNAYWVFTRQARGKPPAITVPEAYKRRNELKDELKELRKQQRESGE